LPPRPQLGRRNVLIVPLDGITKHVAQPPAGIPATPKLGGENNNLRVSDSLSMSGVGRGEVELRVRNKMSCYSNRLQKASTSLHFLAVSQRIRPAKCASYPHFFARFS